MIQTQKLNHNVLYHTDPRGYAIWLVEECGVSQDCFAHVLLTACLKYMSTEDVQNMLDANELSPRFTDD